MSSQSSVTKRLDGKVALITGGASGLGECTARLFVKHGAKVLVADIQDDLGHSLCQDLGTENIGYVHCDVTCESDVENAVNLVVSKYGKLDIMFNNAGIIGDNEHAARVMVPAKKGCILFTSSLSSKISYGNPHAYKASKHAVTGLTKSLSVELGEHGIRVNCISPHATATPLFQKTLGLFDKKKGEEMIAASAVLKGTVLEPEDFANAALYLASDEAKYVSGVNLPIDGGYCLSNQSWKLGFAALSQ
ncbi:Momilactone A synthase [Hibiscus syriacus]|uniref:Momilactone A synthase n=1 Tax=Hibiscus syriacus TaxID=106335 RepID=A0A6A3CDG3_HIBSY|nr:Momilactone A synthase [Hibiscus syriacus]